MRRVGQQRLVEIDEAGIRVPESQGDCYPACIASIFELPLELAPGYGGDSQAVWDWLARNYPGIGMVVRDWPEPREAPHHTGFWIATVVSTRFRERDCGWCHPARETSDPPRFYRQDECPRCGGTGHGPGLHAIVMENTSPVWDPHPEAHGLADEYACVGETYFTVTDPARLAARSMPA